MYPEIVFGAAKQSGAVLRYVDEFLRMDPEFVLEEVMQS